MLSGFWQLWLARRPKRNRSPNLIEQSGSRSRRRIGAMPESSICFGESLEFWSARRPNRNSLGESSRAFPGKIAAMGGAIPDSGICTVGARLPEWQGSWEEARRAEGVLPRPAILRWLRAAPRADRRQRTRTRAGAILHRVAARAKRDAPSRQRAARFPTAKLFRVRA